MWHLKFPPLMNKFTMNIIKLCPWGTINCPLGTCSRAVYLDPEIDAEISNFLRILHIDFYRGCKKYSLPPALHSQQHKLSLVLLVFSILPHVRWHIGFDLHFSHGYGLIISLNVSHTHWVSILRIMNLHL